MADLVVEDARELSKDRLAFAGERYSSSNPWLVNPNVRLFSVTVRTT